VLDVDLAQLPPEVTLPGRYDRAFVLIRQHGRPVGSTTLPVYDGRIDGLELREATLNAAGWNPWEHWLHDYLGWNQSHTMNWLPPPVTIAVCTRDRPADLRRCLEALLHQPDDGKEILVIDNCPSTAETRNLVARYDGIRYIREDRPGLNVARNRAMKEARHEVVCYTDDDAAPEPGWHQALVRNFDDPRVLCVTGLTLPLELETPAQEHFERYSTFSRGFRRKVFDRFNLHPMAAGLVGAGVNMAIRRSAIDLIGPFAEELDAGTTTRSGGDNEMFSRILAAGYQIVYDPAALSWHCHRRTWREVRQAFYGYGVGVYAAWTRSLLVNGELTVLKPAWSWFWHSQLPRLARSVLKRPDSIPPDLILAELLGCTVGPWAYLLSSRRLRRRLVEA
jgi:glycosyltransferase involved in cell wall biosynthesis